MKKEEHTYIAIDLKSFYASAECVDRGLDPLTTNLVVADASRTQKTICLAVSPSLKVYGIPGRPRLFEVVQKVKEVNRMRARRIQDRRIPDLSKKDSEDPEDHRLQNTAAQNSESNVFAKIEAFAESNAFAKSKAFAESKAFAKSKAFAENEGPAHSSRKSAFPHREEADTEAGGIPRTGRELLLLMENERSETGNLPSPGSFSGTSSGSTFSGKSFSDSPASGVPFSGSSFSAPELETDPSLEADYIIAVPRMAHYIEYSTKIYQIYLRYIALEDIHVYSIDEVMMDVTRYLPLYKKTAHELAMEMIRAVLKETGITATAGIGPNLYLCKIAMDIEAKHTAPDADGVRIAELDEMSYRRKLWGHRPITDFWRVGKGTAKKLARYGMFTMGDVARCSLEDEDLLYKLFGVNAELLIDHAWGWEPCTIDLIKAYKPQNRSFSAGQVLQCAYSAEKARIVVREMADSTALDLVEKRLLTDQLVLTVVYDNENLSNPEIRRKYKGPVKKDWYGRNAPKPAHGTVNLGRHTSSSRRITDAVLDLYDRIVDPDLLVRRIYLATNHIVDETAPGKASPAAGAADLLSASPADGPDDPSSASNKNSGHSGHSEWQQLDLFTDYEALEREKEREQAALEKERRLQEAMLSIRRKYGKNAILKGTSLQEGATMRERNQSIGGHKA